MLEEGTCRALLLYVYQRSSVCDMTAFQIIIAQLLKQGHYVQAMFVNFGLAESANGDCLLRFDDTNPETERAEFVDSINDIVCWLGYKPSQVGQRVSQALSVLHASHPCQAL